MHTVDRPARGVPPAAADRATVRVRTVVAAAVVAAYAFATAAVLVLQVVGDVHEDDPLEGVVLVAVFGLLTLLGCLLIVRRPGHPMGPLFAGTGLLVVVSLPGDTYAAAKVIAGEAVPLWARVSAWPTTFTWYVVLAVVVVYVPLLFPDGHLPSPRWRWPAWLVGAGVVVLCTLSAVAEQIVLETLGPGGRELAVANPFGVAGMPYGEDNPLFDPIGSVLLLGAVAAVAAVVVRFRRSRGPERQQVKWLLFAVSISCLAVLSGAVPLPAWTSPLSTAADLLGIAGVPVAVTVAVLRYRLYEIDRVISRTVTYAVVSAVLLVVYAGVTVLPSAVLNIESDLLVAAATLTAAAVFVPVRRRVQAVVDRRFNRARYDAQRVIDRFGTRLRADLDIDGLTGDLCRVVAATVQPAHVWLWVRGDRP